MTLMDGNPDGSLAGAGGVAKVRQGRLRRMAMRLQRWHQLRRERQQLWRLSDAMLKDIGLSRADVEREAARSSWEDAGRDG